jgi:hypothetical protein
VIGNWQLCPDATLMSPVEFSPQSASSTNFGQSEAASAGDADIEPVAPTISAKAAILDNRMVDFLVSCSALTGAIGTMSSSRTLNLGCRLIAG